MQLFVSYKVVFSNKSFAATLARKRTFFSMNTFMLRKRGFAHKRFLAFFARERIFFSAILLTVVFEFIALVISRY